MNELEALRFAANILRTLSVSAEAADYKSEAGDKEVALRAARMLDSYAASSGGAIWSAS
jgi:hypothetical protein